MSLWDKFCYYVGLAGLIGIPIALVVDIIRFGLPEAPIVLRGLFGIAMFGIAFSQGKKAKQVAKERERQKHL